MKPLTPNQLPEGIEEALPEEARMLEAYRRQLLDCFESWGYALVSPPLVEFRDALVTDGDALDRQTFRLTDPLSGRTLGVRTDITPQVARIDRQQMPQDQVVRLCYAGSVLRAHPEILGGGRNPIQVGAELYGHEGLQSDTEIVLLLCAVLQASGCARWCLDMGHAGVFRVLVEQTDWSVQECGELFELIQRKAHVDIGAWLDARSSDVPVAGMLRTLPDLSGPDEEVLDRALQELEGVREQILPALEILRAVAARVRSAYPEVQLHFDLGEASGFHYESGLVFAAYVEGQGQEIARGGRYGAQGGRPAIGFSLDLRTLADCGSLNAAKHRRIYASANEDSGLQDAIVELRAQGHIVVCGLNPGDSAAGFQCPEQLVSEDGAWVVRPVVP